jgi:ABC-type multidrug transport system ATPase subunit
MTSPVPLRYEEVRSGLLGPWNLTLEAGQTALWLEEDSRRLRSLWKLALGQIPPDSGQIFWLEKARPPENRLWAGSAFRRLFAWIEPSGRPLSGITLGETLFLYYYCSEGFPEDESRHLADEVLAGLDLRHLAGRTGEKISEEERPLALAALALAKEPRLLFLDRPQPFFAKSWPRFRQILTELQKTKDLALVIFDSQPALWSRSESPADLIRWPG